MIYGYMRISNQKEKQTTDRQRITLEAYSKESNSIFDDIVEERISGTVKAENREVFDGLKNKTLRKDYILIVTDLNRLGRAADDAIAELKDFKA